MSLDVRQAQGRLADVRRRLRDVALVLAAPAIRALPPWWKVRVYGRLADTPFHQGGHASKTVTRRIQPHRYEMELCLDDWMERFAFYVGCYYEVDATATLDRLLRRGDCYIDVGANLGFLALTASRAVGFEGRVLAFEPNPTLAARLTRALRVNEIDNVTVFEHALGSVDALATLDIGSHSGTANLRGAEPGAITVNVRRGDSVVTDLQSDTWVLAKLDVEGYELRVLQGFTSLIQRPRTGFLVEVTDAWLRELEGSADELFGLLQQDGYQAYLPRLGSSGALHFAPIDGPRLEHHQYDVLFLRTQDGWLER